MYVDSHSSYYRNANRKLDSINIRTIPDEQRYYRSFKFTGVTTFDTPDKTYLLLTALRVDPQFNPAFLNSEMLLLHQFLNPNDNLLSSGNETLFKLSDQDGPANYSTPFNHYFNLYPDKKVRTIIPYLHNSYTKTQTAQRTMRFEYL